MRVALLKIRVARGGGVDANALTVDSEVPLPARPLPEQNGGVRLMSWWGERRAARDFVSTRVGRGRYLRATRRRELRVILAYATRRART